MRFQIVQGYIKFDQVENGKLIEKGGFIEDSEKGMMLGILDTKTNTIVSAHFNSIDAESDIERLEAESN